ncbi:MAG: tetratricopeptide repeat protein [bacterium]
MAKNTGNKDKFISKAQTFIKRGKMDNAIKEYQNALEVDKKDVRVLQKLGELYSRKNQKKEAIDYLSKAAQYLYKDGFYSKAVALYSQILKVDEDQIDAVKSLGDCYMKLGLNAQAMAQFKKIASQYEKEGKLQEALDITQNMLDMDPRNHVLATKLAELYYKLGKKDEGYQSFMRALDQLHEDGHYEQYVKLREKLIKIDPENMENLKELAPVYTEHEQWEKAYAVLARICKNEPEELEYLSQLANVALKVGRPEEAANTWKEVARIYKSRGLRQKAKDSLRKVLKIKPDDQDALAVVGKEEHSLEEEPQEVEEVIEEPLEVLDEDEEEETAAAGDEEVVIDSGAPVEAGGEEEDEEAEGMSESQIMEHLTEAGVYLKYGLKDKSLTHVRKVLQADPQNLKARQVLKDIHLESGDTAEAIKELEKITRLANSAGEAETARKAVEDWLRLDPENAKAKQMYSEIAEAPVETEEISAAEIVADEEEELEAPAAEEDIPLETPQESAPEEDDAIAVEAEEEFEEPEEIIEAEEEEVTPLTQEVSMGAEEAGAAEGPQEAEAVEEEHPALPEDDEDTGPVEVATQEEEPAPESEEVVMEEEEEPAPAKQEEVSEPAPAKAEEPAPPAGEHPSRDFSEELDEAEFYLQHGLPDEAKKIYAAVLEKDSGNQTALKKLNELAEQETEEVVITEEEATVGFMEEPEATGPEAPRTATPEPVAPPSQPEAQQAPTEPEPPPVEQEQTMNELPAEEEPVVPEPPPPEPEAEAAPEPEAEASEEEVQVPAEPAMPAELEAEAEPEPADMEAELEAEVEAEAGPLAEEEEVATEEEEEPEPVAPPPPPAPAKTPPSPAEPSQPEEKFDLKKEMEGEEEGFFIEPSAPPGDDLFGSAGEDEELFDLAAELEKEDDLEMEGPGFGMGSTSEEFSFEATLSAFKKGVAQTVSEQDSHTHFDLAIAYREMGLYDEAIQSFFTASGDPSKYSECMLLVSMIFREKGDLEKAVQTAAAALGSDNVREQDLAGLYSELGKALKEKGENPKALWSLQKTKETDPSFPEIDGLISELEGVSPEPVSLGPEEDAAAPESSKEAPSPPLPAGPPPTRDKTSWENAALDESNQAGADAEEAEDESKKKKRKKISYV